MIEFHPNYERFMRVAAAQLRFKVEEMESAIQTADTSISPLRGLESPRIVRDLEAWDEAKSNFTKILQSVLGVSEEFFRIAQQFDDSAI